MSKLDVVDKLTKCNHHFFDIEIREEFGLGENKAAQALGA